MTREELIHSTVGVELVRKLAAEGDRIFTVERARALAPSVGLSQGYLRQALHYLAKAGWIVRLRKGLYALSSSVPGIQPTHEFEVAMALASPAAIGYWSAFHYHGLTEQTPRSVFVLTTTEATVPRMRKGANRRSGPGYRVGDTVYRFVQVKPGRYFGTMKVWVGEVRVEITDPERTLLDGLMMPQYCGDFSEVLHAFEVRGPDLDMDRIIAYALKLDTATAKRLGWVLDYLNVEATRLNPLARLDIKGYRKLDPTGPRKGPCNRRWTIQENLPGRVAA